MTAESAEAERFRARAVELGKAASISASDELIGYLSHPAPRVRRAAASAIQKIVLAHTYNNEAARIFVVQLYIKALDETSDQVREYMLKALAACASAMMPEMVRQLRDLARNPTLKPYVRAAANEASSAGELAIRHRAAASETRCTRCHRRITPEEAEKGLVKYGKPYCYHCFDERILEDVNFEKNVEEAKRLRTTNHVAVQSQGEKRIGDYLAKNRIRFVYDERYRIAADAVLRPDFYLPEFDLYIEYWGMDTDDYLERRREKQFLYRRAGKKLISLTPDDLPRMEEILREKLARYIAL